MVKGTTTLTNTPVIETGNGFAYLDVDNGGRLTVSNANVQVDRFEYKAGSSGWIDGGNLNTSPLYILSSDVHVWRASLGGPITIQNALPGLRENNFQVGCTIAVTGSPTAHIDAVGNYWNTTDPAEIAARVTDHDDNATRPYVDVAPFRPAAVEDAVGAYVYDYSPTGRVPPGIDRVQVWFDEAVTGFSGEDMLLTTPAGDVPGADMSVVEIAGSGAREFEISFPPQTLGGQYTLAIGPEVYDLAGHPLEVNHNGVSGENPGDVVHVSFLIDKLPVAGNDSYATNEDTPLVVAAPGVLVNDADGDNDPLTAKLVSDVSSGTLTLNPDGSFTYSPKPDCNGSDQFTYQANDGYGDSNEATVTINVTAVNDAPAGSDRTVTTLGHWALDESSGSTASDTGGLGNHGTLQDNPSHVPGQFGNALQFDGSNNVLTPITSASVVNGFTVAAWARYTDCPDQRGIAGIHQAGSQNGFFLGAGYDSKFRFFVQNSDESGPDSGMIYSLAGGYNDGTWHHLVGSFDGNQRVFYVDGVKQGENPGQMAVWNDEPFLIGGTRRSDGYLLGFSGGVDDVRLYDEALSEQEVRLLFESSSDPERLAIVLREHETYAFEAADFGFQDPNDTPANALLAVKITTLPALGSLQLDGSAVTAGQVVAVGDIDANKFTFTPAADEYGSPYTSFTFQVRDDGGTANGGVDLDPSPNTLTINVTPQSDATPDAVNDRATVAKGGTVTALTFDLAADWSDAANPHSLWSYNDSLGPITVHQTNWGSHVPVWEDQDAWALAATGFGHIVAWLKADRTLGAPWDVHAGDVLTHTWDGYSGTPDRSNLSSVTWTAPSAGSYDFSGSFWQAYYAGRSADASVFVNGVQFTSVSLSDGAGFSRNAPFTFGATGVSLSAGDTIELRFVTTSPAGTLVGVDFAVTGSKTVLDNDTGLADTPIAVSLVTGPAHASAFTLNEDGTFSYTHDGSENLTDSFTYMITDNDGQTDTATVTIDAAPLSVAVNIIDTSLNVADNASNVTFTFSEPVSGFTVEDVSAAGGTLSGFSGSGSSYSATFTATHGVETTGSVSVAAGSYTDAVGNLGGAGSDTVAIDTRNPTVTVNILDGSLNDADNASTVTFTFSEPVTDFTAEDVMVAGGTLSGFSGNGSSFSATFTADDGVETTGSVTIAAGSYTDAVGNLGGTGSDTVAIDTRNPTVVSLIPADNSTGVALDTNLVLAVDRPIRKGAGNILIRKTSDGSIVETIPVTSDRVTVTESPAPGSLQGRVVTVPLPGAAGVYSPGDTVTTGFDAGVQFGQITGVSIHWTGTLTAGLADGDGVEMPSGNPFPWPAWFEAYTPATPPYRIGYFGSVNGGGVYGQTVPFDTVTTMSPFIGDAQQELLDGVADVTFELGQLIGIGVRVLVPPWGQINSAELRIEGAWSVTIDPSTTLAESTGYYVEVDAGAVESLTGNDFAGIDGPTAWNFVTGDFTRPTVMSVTAGPPVLSDDDVGPAKCVVTVAFSEAMAATPAPTLTFLPAVASTLTLASGSWTDSTHYTATYDVADANVDVDAVQVDVTGAKDAAGNAQQDYTPESEFDIDTENPAAPVVTGIADDTGTAGDGITSDTTLLISGTAEANSNVEVFKDDTSIGSGAANGSGVWILDYTGTTLGQGSFHLTARSSDAAGNVSAASAPFGVKIDTTAPAVTVTSLTTSDTTPAIAGTVSEGTLQVLVNGKTYTAGDGNLLVSGTEWTLQIPDLDALAVGTYEVAASATDAAGNAGADGTTNELVIQSQTGTFAVTMLTPTSTGFVVEFNRQLEPSVLNLYAGQGAMPALGVADVVLRDGSNAAVAGSLVLDSGLQKATFIKTNGLLAAGTYTVTLRSAADGFKDKAAGELLNGGTDYIGSFVIAAPPTGAVTVAVPYFVRGPKQEVNVPASAATGIPLTLSDGANVESVDLVLRYNPALLNITGATVGAGLPADAGVMLNFESPDVLRLGFHCPTPLSPGKATFVNLQASVPDDAGYTAKHLLDLQEILINEGQIPALEDDGLHVVAYFGDATGNGTYSSLDTSRVSRVVVGLDSGFAAYQLADPVVVADITGNGNLSSLDTSRVSRVAVGLPVAEVPARPSPAATIVPSGPDPKLSIPKTLVASPGDTVNVPVDIDSIVDLTGSELMAADLVLFFDPNVVTVNSVALGAVPLGSPGADWANPLALIDNNIGRVRIGVWNNVGLGGTFAGSLVTINVTVKSASPAGASAINLVATNGSDATLLNEGGLTLIPAPTNARNDEVDGQLLINGAPSLTLTNTITTLAENTDTTTRIKMADLVVTDDGVGNNVLSLSGADSGLFEIDGNGLYLKAGTRVDYETNPALDVTVAVDDATVGTTPDDPEAISVTVTNKDERLELTVAPGVISESGGSATATLTRYDGDNRDALVVTLIGNDASEATVPASVTIQANQASVTFTVTAQDDNLLDGTQTVTITANPSGDYTCDQATVDVTDHETLSVTIAAASIAENAGAAATTATVTRSNTDNGQELVVTLTNGDPTEVDIPATVTIPANQASASFDIGAVDDSLLDGTQTVTLTASAGGYVAGSETLDVTDYETLIVTVSPDTISEGGGTATGTVMRNNTDLDQPLVVTLTSDDETEATVPATVTIPADQASATFTITAQDDTLFDGTQTAGIGATAAGYATPPKAMIQVTDDEVLVVLALVPTTTGFVAQFNQQIDPGVLNLYDGQGGGFGTVDVVVRDGAGSLVKGSLVLATDLRSVTFVKTGGILGSGTYSITLRSADNGFRDQAGRLLYGQNGGTTQGDYATSFTVASPPAGAVTVIIPDFSRGPGQAVNIPANVTTGIPLTLSDGAGVQAVDLRLHYDPALLNITGATLASGMPANSGVTVNFEGPGVLRLGFYSPTPLSPGRTPFANLQAQIPESAGYTAKQLLDLLDLSINEGAKPGVDDDGIHVVAYLGDATGNGTYSSLDASYVSRLAVRLDSGLAAYPLADPVLIADVTDNGSVSSLDTAKVSREVVGLDAPEIAPLPSPPLSIVQRGPDPRLSIPHTLNAAPGEMLTVPIEIDSIVDLTGHELVAVDLVIRFDPRVLQAGSAALGELPLSTPEAAWSNPVVRVDNDLGVVILGVFNQQGVGGHFAGSLVTIRMSVAADAPEGPARINLAASSTNPIAVTYVNEGRLTLIPTPTNADDDAVDGVITVGATEGGSTSQPSDEDGEGQARPTSRPCHTLGPCHTLDVNEDGEVTPLDVLRMINEMHRRTDAGLAGQIPPAGPWDVRLDVSGDGLLSAIDVLQAVNYFNEQTARSNSSRTETNAAEGESLSPAAFDDLFEQEVEEALDEIAASIADAWGQAN